MNQKKAPTSRTSNYLLQKTLKRNLMFAKTGRNQNFSAEKQSSFVIAVNFITADHNLGFALKYFNSLLFCRILSSV
jgi:hypothetical protein